MTHQETSLTVIVTAHCEGRILHKTIRSVLESITFAKTTLPNLSIDLMITLDRSDDETARIAEACEYAPKAIHRLDYGDAGQARNAAIERTTAEYVMIIDGDDLVSENFIAQALQTAQEHPNSIVHAEYSLTFGKHPEGLWRKHNSVSKEQDAVYGIGANRWDNMFLCPRSVFETVRFSSHKNLYKYEDWHFNLETLAAGVAHVVAPQTVLFVRRKRIGSLLVTHASGGGIMAPTKMFDYSFMRPLADTVPGLDLANWKGDAERSIPKMLVMHTWATVKPTAELLYNAAQKHPHLKRAAKGLYVRARQVRSRFHSDPSRLLPEWFAEEMRKAHVIEKEIFPSKAMKERVVGYSSEHEKMGRAYLSLLSQTTARPDVVIFVPWLNPGGADKVAIRYANTIARLYPDLKVCVVSTENKASSWAGKLDSAVDFVEIRGLVEILGQRDAWDLMAQFIVQNKVKIAHVINSQLGYELVERYGASLALSTHLVASIFCEDITDEGEVGSYLHSHLPYVYDHLEAVYTDNQTVIDQLKHEYGYLTDKVTTHYQPVDAIGPAEHTVRSNPEAPLRILWAGRLAKQKRPDVLRRIAERLDPRAYQIDVYGPVYESTYNPSYFEGSSSIVYKGEYQDILAINPGQYDVFLYTAESDGMPNMLLEIGELGMPIISTPVGGIPEIVAPHENGMLVDSIDDIDGFVAALQDCKNNPSQWAQYGTQLRQKIVSRHNSAAFEASIRSYIDTILR